MCRTAVESLWLQKDCTLSAYHHDFPNVGNLYLYCFIFSLHAMSCMLLWVALKQLAVTLKSLWTASQTSLDVFHVSMLFQISSMNTIKKHMLVFTWCGFIFTQLHVQFGDSAGVFLSDSQWPKKRKDKAKGFPSKRPHTVAVGIIKSYLQL